MATYSSLPGGDGTVITHIINALVQNEVGAGIDWSEFQDRSVQISGTFGTATVLVEGSNDNINWFTLSNAAGGTALSFTAAGLRQVLEASLWMRVRVTGGDGTTNLNAAVFLRRASSIRT